METEKTNLDVWAVILARGGSKRLKNKNKRFFLGKPLVEWTIDAALDSCIFSQIILSSDDKEILEIGQAKDIAVRSRPSCLALDDTPSSLSVIDALEFTARPSMSPPNIVCLLQPTSPLRTSQHIRDAWGLFVANRYSSLVSVSEDRFSADDIKPNGALYFRRYLDLKSTNVFIDSRTRKFGMANNLSIDIDSAEDFDLAEMRARDLLL